MKIIRCVDYNVKYKNIDKNTLLFVSASYYCNDKTINIAKSNICDDIVLLANNQEEKDFFELQVDNEVLLMPQNAFLDETIFNVNDEYKKSKKYDMIINSAFHSYKNVWLGKLCTNTVHVGYNWNNDIVYPTYGHMANFNDDIKKNKYKRINENEIVKLNNMSYVGGIFSYIEGNCRASSEYLMCGIPVVSTMSQGGRDIWYNDYNSLICENNEESVLKCVTELKNKVINCEIDAYKIRSEHISTMNYYRNKFVNYVNNKLDTDIYTYDNMKKDIKHKS